MARSSIPASTRAVPRGLGGAVRRPARRRATSPGSSSPISIPIMSASPAGWPSASAVPLWMSREEWLFARMLTADVRDARRARPSPTGAPPAGTKSGSRRRRRRAGAASPRWSARCRSASSGCGRRPDPRSARATGGSSTGSGHCPEHACLVDEAGGVMIAGDQVLPRITSNVSLEPQRARRRPARRLARLDRQAQDAARQPARPALARRALHRPPRPRSMRSTYGHRDRLDALHEHLAEPRRAVDCFSHPVRPQDRRQHASASRPAKRWRICGGWRSRGGGARASQDGVASGIGHA